MIGESKQGDCAIVDDDRGWPGASGGSPAKYRGFNDEALIVALRHEESGAFLEFVRRFQGLALKFARHFSVAPEFQDEWVNDVLTDVVLFLMKRGAILPESLAAYIARACRNKAYMEIRSRTRRRARETSVSYDAGVVPAVDWESTASSPALQKLLTELEKILTAEERRLLDWSSESVPLRMIAEWCGISRTGASHRINRLRQRLQKLTPQIVAGFEPSERAEIGRFLLRAKGF
jgi:RNA polymerase sigma factor (sigma-70 family)